QKSISPELPIRGSGSHHHVTSVKIIVQQSCYSTCSYVYTYILCPCHSSPAVLVLLIVVNR
ncbi:hypothetical protein BDV28DRAFT_134689, partial [Aspergillus coremiiformis]